METNKETNQATPGGQTVPPNIPEWVLHLLTGLGTMGAEYMMFIRPLQEKLELQGKLIKEQGERIDYLEELLQARGKTKRSLSDNEEEDDDQDLFQVKRKGATIPKYGKHARIKL